ncbi:uncharacterized protein LACBIDRAFT_327098 [Laccaria bicolor S238N-H82]|uniref:Predicted protein n=1 Tax=Laccaria bicolor (strain S238N-H82 / ATCC MYA-4686) TaxID=486041 RepID=B0DAN0_LACBS|nr:uncharacterized protein LACBIDRAFT_327098 [Laccaria bicolor S238N-H82]EDR08778.1 predicted protein [Laccaria bicolor S238N-H82]|eukprot:XP_001881003.1 predicted protein [Laccaria bicolor S238N-H82]
MMRCMATGHTLSWGVLGGTPFKRMRVDKSGLDAGSCSDLLALLKEFHAPGFLHAILGMRVQFRRGLHVFFPFRVSLFLSSSLLLISLTSSSFYAATQDEARRPAQ